MPILYEQPAPYNGDARLALRGYASAVRNNRGAAEAVAQGFESIQNVVNALISGLTNTVNGEFSQVVVTAEDTGEVIGWIGSDPSEGYEGGWFKNLYVGGSGPTTAPLIADANGRVTLTLGDGDDQGYLSVLNSGGDTVVWAGKTGTDYGLWASNLWVGGTGPSDAPLFSDGSNVVIGENGRVFIWNTRGQTKGFIGVQTEASQVVTGAANNGSGLIRLTVTAHGYETGDTVDVSSVGGVPNATGSWGITVITANTFDLIGSTFGGAYTAGGTVYRYYGGVWAETAAFGVTGFADARFRVFADSSLRIGVAGGARMEVSAAGALSLTNVGLTITDGNNVIVINGTDGVKVSDTGTSPNPYAQLLDGQATISDGVSRVLISQSSVQIRYQSGGSRIENFTTSGGSFTEWYNSAGAKRAEVDIATGFANFQSLRVGNNEVVSSTQVGKFTSLDIGGVADVIDASRNADFNNVNADGVFMVDGTQVVTNQQAAIPDVAYVVNAAAATYNLGKDNLLFNLQGQFNNVLAMLRTHGLIAT